ncbi:MAG: hypothetical protein ABSD12_17255 [Paraburkholderia sp.]|jgi:hypothetical protein
MANPNSQRLERGHLLTATLVGTYDADVFIRRPDGTGEHPTRIDLSPFFAHGMTEGEALEAALEFIAIGVRAAS